MADSETTVNFDLPRGTLTLTGYPKGAQFTLLHDNQIVTSGGLPATISKISAGQYEVEFSYLNERVQKQVSVDAGNIVTCDGTLPFGNIQMSVTGAKGAAKFELRRDNVSELTGSLPDDLHDVKAGEVEIIASDEISAQSQHLTIATASTSKVNFEFAYGGANITSVPEGATLELSSSVYKSLSGTTPFYSNTIPIGIYNVTLTYKGASKPESLSIERGKTALLNSVLPVGNISIAHGVSGESFLLRGDDNGIHEEVSPDVSTAFPIGNYTLETRYNGILLTKKLHVETAITTTVNPFSETGSLNILTNTPGITVTLVSNGDVPISLSGIAPMTIEALPYGTYVLSSSGESAQTFNVEIRGPAQEAKLIFKRQIFDVLSDDNDLRSFPVVTQTFPNSYASVWDAVNEESTSGLFNAAPDKINIAAGWLYTKRSVYDIGLFHNIRVDRRAVLVTDMLGATEVQVITKLYEPRGITSNGVNQIVDFPFLNDSESSKMSHDFLDAIAKRLDKK